MIYWENDHDWLPQTIYTFQSPNTEVVIRVLEEDTGSDDILEERWKYPDLSADPANYIPNGLKSWWYGADRRDADLQLQSDS